MMVMYDNYCHDTKTDIGYLNWMFLPSEEDSPDLHANEKVVDADLSLHNESGGDYSDDGARPR